MALAFCIEAAAGKPSSVAVRAASRHSTPQASQARVPTFDVRACGTSLRKTCESVPWLSGPLTCRPRAGRARNWRTSLASRVSAALDVGAG